MRQYSVWHDCQEQWDPDHIDEPALRCEARDALTAAERLADGTDDNCVSVIVRDDADNTFRSIELVRSWSVTRHTTTTLADLCAP